MLKCHPHLNIEKRIPAWLTIRETVKLINGKTGGKITESDIYRYVLYGEICISIYFQSPIVLRKIKSMNNKIKLTPVGNSLIQRLCLLDKNSFISGKNLILSTEGEFIYPASRVIDTPLLCFEYVLLQRLLANTLKIPLPIVGVSEDNYGITVSLFGENFQIFEKISWQKRIKQQIMRLPKNTLFNLNANIPTQYIHNSSHKHYFPIHELPSDACFVIRHSEVEKIISTSTNSKSSAQTSTRISTPISRLFWLACKNNDAISPLIRQPYKLLSIFEQWASAEGITDRLSGDTLKTALERGSPTPTSPSN